MYVGSLQHSLLFPTHQGITAFSRTETRQTFSSMFAIAKEIESCLPLL